MLIHSWHCRTNCKALNVPMECFKNSQQSGERIVTQYGLLCASATNGYPFAAQWNTANNNKAMRGETKVAGKCQKTMAEVLNGNDKTRFEIWRSLSSHCSIPVFRLPLHSIPFYSTSTFAPLLCLRLHFLANDNPRGGNIVFNIR